MSKENGFVPIRRGLWEHVRDGRMSPFEALAFVYICSQADTRTGVWKGSAGALVTELGFIPRTARDLLERMEHGGYIRRFVSQGLRHCYPILIHKFPVTQGEHNGEVLDALSSTKQDGCLDLRYISCEVHGEVDGEVHGKVHASQRRSENRELRKPLSPSVSELPIAEGFEQFYATYPRHVARADAEKAWRQVVKPEEVPAILARIEINKLGEWKEKEKRFIPYPASWLRGRRWNDEIEKGEKLNGKQSSVGDRMRATLAAAFGEPKTIM
jgi:hypothetical protein